GSRVNVADTGPALTEQPERMLPLYAPVIVPFDCRDTLPLPWLSHPPRPLRLSEPLAAVEKSISKLSSTSEILAATSQLDAARYSAPAPARPRRARRVPWSRPVAMPKAEPGFAVVRARLTEPTIFRPKQSVPEIDPSMRPLRTVSGCPAWIPKLPPC